MFSLSFFFRSPSLILKSTAIKLSITDQAVSSFYVHHCSMVWRPHQSMVCHRSTSLFGILIALSPHRSCNHRSRHADLGFVGLCLWMWMWVGAGGGFGMWVCANLSGCVFFFFFGGGIGGCGFVSMVAVGVVAAMVAVLLVLLLLTMMMRMIESN